MSMTHIVSVLGHGDCLITLSLLERAGEQRARVRLVGTGATESVSRLLRHPVTVDMRVLDGMAAFFKIKESSLFEVVRDTARFYRWANGTGQAGGTLVMENDDWRSRLLLRRNRWQRIDTPRLSTAYQDREAVLRPWLGHLPWPMTPRPASAVRHLVINPSARTEDRVLPRSLVGQAAALARDAGAEVSLIDVDGRHAGLRTLVTNYLQAPSLADAAAVLQRGDRYLGPDSFFIHLAYYYAVPHFGFYHPKNLYFLTPTLRETGHWSPFSEAAAPSRIAARLSAFMAAH